MLYDIIYSGAFWRQLRRIDRSDQKRILDKIESLAENPRPHGYKKLVDKEVLYRIRVGNYRIIYEIFDGVLVVNILQVKKRNERTY